MGFGTFRLGLLAGLVSLAVVSATLLPAASGTKTSKQSETKKAARKVASNVRTSSTSSSLSRRSDAQSRLQDLLDSARKQSVALNRITALFAETIEDKQRNVRNTAKAVYLLEHANNGPAYLGSDITWPQFAVLRSVLKSDATELKYASSLEQPLRAALSASNLRLAQLETTITAAGRATTTTIHSVGAAPDSVETSTTIQTRVSTATADLIAEEYFSKDAAHNLPAGISETIEAAEKFIREQQSLVSLGSFAPPPPKTNTMDIISPSSSIPQEFGGKMRPAPPPPRLQSPTHNGIDIALKKNADVRAIACGSVVYSGPFRGYGNLIVIEHAGSYFSIYGFLDLTKVSVGDAVTTGQKIGEPGKLASNTEGFHFELRKSEIPAEPRELAGSKDLMGLIAPGGRVSSQEHH